MLSGARAACVCVATVIAIGTTAQQASAQTSGVTNDFALRITSGRSDNVFRAANTPRASSYRGLGFVVNSQRDGARFDSSVQADVEAREYSLPNVGTQHFGSLNAFLGASAIPNVFSWDFNENYGQGPVNSYLPVSPANQQDVNIFTTGPRFNLLLGDRNAVRLSGTKGWRRFDNSFQLDSDTEEVELGFFRALSPVTEIGLSWSARDIEYIDQPLFDWSSTSLAIVYNRQLATGAASLQVGETELEIGGFKTSSPLVDLAWSRRVGVRSQLVVAATRGQGDPGYAFARANLVGNPGAIGSGNAFILPGVYDFADVSVRTNINFQRTLLSFGVGNGETDYEGTDLNDYDTQRYFFVVTRDLSERATLGLNLNVFERNFVTSDIVNTDRNYQISFSHEFGRRLDFRVAYIQRSRDSRGTAPFDENAYVLSLYIDLNP